MLGLLAAALVLGVAGLVATPPDAESASIVSVSVRPARKTVPPNQTIQFKAIVKLSDGTTRNVTNQATWSVSNTALAQLVRGQVGQVRTRAPGRVEVQARISGRLASTPLFIDPGPVVRLVTRPSSKKLEIDRPTLVEARLVHESGYQKNVTSEVIWSSSNRDVARLQKRANGTWMVVPRALGTTVITAHHKATGLSNSDGLTFVLKPITRIGFESKGEVLGRGMELDLRVLGFHGGANGETSRIRDGLTFSATPAGIVELEADGDEAGHVKALEDGVVTIHARHEERELDTKGRGLRITVAGTLKGLEVSPDPLNVNAGDSRNATVLGVLSSGKKTGDLRKKVVWSVGDSDIARVGNDEDDVGLVEGLEPGTTTLRARDPVTGVRSTATDNLVVRGRVVDLTVEPETAVLGLDLELPLRAYAHRDDETRSNVSNNVEWSVEPEGVVDVDESGRLTGLANGTATVTAVDPKTDLEASAQVTVAGRMTSLRITPKPFRVDVGDDRSARAIGTLSGGLETSDLAEVVDWSVKDATIARIGNGQAPPEGETRLERGEVLGVKLGSTTFRAVEPITKIATPDTDLFVQIVDEDPDPGPDPDPDPDPGSQPILVLVEPGNGGVVVRGATVKYKARATLVNGDSRNISDKCEWSTDDPSVASVDNELPNKGSVTGHQIGGSTLVRVDCDGLVAAATVSVLGEVMGLKVVPSSFDERVPRPVTIGNRKQIRAIAIHEGGVETDVTDDAHWYSTNPEVADVEDREDANPGRVTLFSPREAFIVATFKGGHFAVCTATVRPPLP